jgi:tight adherence protein B
MPLAVSLLPLAMVVGPLKWGACVLFTLATALATFATASNPRSVPYTWWRSYDRLLERRLRELFLTTRSTSIAVTQCVLLVVVAAAVPVVGWRWGCVLALVVALGPVFHLARLRTKRLRALEGQIEPFLVSLTNALRATSSIGNALASVEPLVVNPMRQELALVIKELRVGSTLDQALLAMAARTHLDDLDTALSSILVARQVGGNLTEVLESTASTLREMARLAAVLRSKTSSGRVQFVVLAAAPVAVVVGFDAASPGYFDPMLYSFTGSLLLLTSATLWLVAIGIARKVLSVSL